MQYTTLSNGIQMPLLGYGVFQVPPLKASATQRSASCGGTWNTPYPSKGIWMPLERVVYCILVSIYQ